MKPEELKELVAKSESEELEFKSSLPNIKLLATLISAFANTKGGKLVVGVRDDGKIVGLKDVKLARSQINRALKAVSPSLEVVTETIGIDDKSVLVATIPMGNKFPYLAYGEAFSRLGAQTKPITSQFLYSNITKRAKSVNDYLPQIKYLTEIIETLNNKVITVNDELIAARSWKRKIPDMLVGGVIGIVLSYLIYPALGL